MNLSHQTSPIPKFSSEQSPKQRAFLRRVALAALAVVSTGSVSLLARPNAAQAQTPPPPPPKKGIPQYTDGRSPDNPSQLNPFPRGQGDSQNRGKAHGDLYWGVTDARRRFDQAPLSRVPNTSLSNILQLDGFTFPQAYSNGQQINGVFGQTLLINPTAAGASSTPPPAGFSGWAGATGPSTDFTLPGGYFRAPAQPRGNGPAIDFPEYARFTWQFNVGAGTNIPGAAGEQRRYRIYVNIPTPPDDTSMEGRISDARYIVYYYIRTAGGGFLPKEKVCFVSQISSGLAVLVGDDGQPAFFPLVSANTPLTDLPDHTQTNGTPINPVPLTNFKQGVQLDNSTEDGGSNLFVLADRLELIPGSDSVNATPVVSPIKTSGRKIAGLDAQGRPVQPRPGPRRGNNDPTDAPLDASDFTNNLLEQRATVAGGLAFDASNQSVTFFGPLSLISPRLRPGGGAYDPNNLGTPVESGRNARERVNATDFSTGGTLTDPISGLPIQRVANSADANNYEIYRPDTTIARTVDGAGNNGGANPAVPYYSHLQILLARTEFAQDPEVGVPDGAKDGTRTIQLGSIHALDWQTGAQIWRFPDITYAPGNARNPQLAPLNATDPAVFTIPGIVTVDKNTNGRIDDDEVFIGQHGNNPSGALFASITLHPSVMVRGATPNLPQRFPQGTGTDAFGQNRDFRINPLALSASQPGDLYRYSTGPDGVNPDGTPNPWAPVPVPVAFIAAANGVLYAVDASGNNDNWYFEHTIANGFPQDDPRLFGRYDAGTTNLLWTFSPRSRPQQQGETRIQYFDRLKTEIPETASFGASAPVLAYRKEADDPTFNPNDITDPLNRLRLFVGNQNGVLYALDATADAGVSLDGANMAIGVNPFPFRKGDQNIGQPVPTNTVNHVADLKWWFRTRGPINAAPAVSLGRHKADDDQFIAGVPVPAQNEKGVYVNSGDGRVYSVDWTGPIRADRRARTSVVYDGLPATATQLNDDYQFRNITPATPTVNGRPDRTEGTIRPRWTFPNLYRDNGNSGVRVPSDRPADNAYATALNALSTTPALADPTQDFSAINSSPVLMDFPWRDPDTGTMQMKHYVVVAARDRQPNGLPEVDAEGRLLLLDQIGDSANFLTNPVVRGFGAESRVITKARDRFSPGFTIGDAAPAWTYRYVYETYTDANDFEPNVRDRNAPSLPGQGGPPVSPVAALTPNDFFTGADNIGVPARKSLPTIYMGGVGRLFAVDIDPETGLLMRWRPSYNETELFTPLPRFPDLGQPGTQGVLFPRTISAVEQRALQPYDPAFTGHEVLRDRYILARTVALLGAPQQITSLVITSGPNQNRSNTHIDPALPRGAAPIALPTTPLFPTLDAPIPSPYVPNLTTVASAFGAPITINNFDPTGFGTGAGGTLERTSVLVNQDINDPMTTTRGSYLSDATIPSTVNPLTDPVANRAFQFPMLVVSTEEGRLHAISSNVEGEDRLTESSNVPGLNIDFEGESNSTSWALVYVDPLRYNTSGHVEQFVQRGPGGAAGVAIVSPSDFPSLDHRFRNIPRHLANPNDPFGYYPENVFPNMMGMTVYTEPNQTGVPATAPGTGTATPVTNYPGGPTAPVTPAANNDDPRPDFKPRPLSLGYAGDAGPDGTVGTDDDRPATPADFSTGDAGFPLDLNGLFFDKRFAGRQLATQATTNSLDPLNPTTGIADKVVLDQQNPNGDYRVRIRLPGYSFIGGSLDPTTEGPIGSNNQAPDGVRVSATDAGLGNINYLEADDINAAGQNITWIYSGGPDGLLYAFTPSLPGQGSGFVGGSSEGPPNPGANGGARAGIFPLAYYQDIDANPRRPDPAATVAAQGGRPFYEWGETIPIIVYDALAQNRTTGGTNGYYVSPGDNIEVRIQNDRGVFLAVQRVSLKTVGGNLFSYPYDQNYFGPGAQVPAGATPPQLGIAMAAVRLINPSQTRPLTPGTNYSVTVTQRTFAPNGQLVQTLARQPGAGGSSAIQAFNPPVGLAVANPMAIQGFLTQTAPNAPNGPLLQASVPKANALDLAGGIGPFDANQNPLSGIKTRVADAPGIDPDKYDSSYNTALVNGNTIVRVDLRQFRTTAGGAAALDPQGNPRTNPAYNSRLTLADGSFEPTFYMPVAASMGMGSHGRSASTRTGSNQQNLRIMNRSLLENLPDVRIDLPEAFAWRTWPGKVPNAAANKPALPPGIAAVNNNNPRYTPPGLDPFGRINPLPWETVPTDSQPWNPATELNGTNVSPDYPDINVKSPAISIVGPTGDMVKSANRLPSALIRDAQNNPLRNTSVDGGDRPGQGPNDRFTVIANMLVPPFQPANIVAMHSLTSTYYAPSQDDNPGGAASANQLLITGQEGPVQLPRTTAATSNAIRRQLHGIPVAGNVADPSIPAVSPFGYTTRALSFIDVNRDGRFSAGTRRNVQRQVSGNNPNDPLAANPDAVEAYREFEMWMGVNIDMSLKVVEETIDTGAEGHGFGIQNGLLGYNQTNGDPSFRPGFIPNPLYNTAVFPASLNAGLYQPFFRKFTVQNTGNVNLYNLRASQKFEARTTTTPGSGFPFQYLQMRSAEVDPRFGILAAGADPNLAANLMPQIVTSLDQQFDSAWNTFIQTNAAFSAAYTTPITTPNGTEPSPFAQYYARLGGRHSLHKALTNSPSPTVLGIPDVPAKYLRPVGEPQLTTVTPEVGVAVPIGTPSGVYVSTFANSPFAIFEDHDTETAYRGTPTVTLAGDDVLIAAAGPLYGGRNNFPPGDPLATASPNSPAGPVAIRAVGNPNGQAEGIFRPRGFNTTTNNLEYLPFTSNFILKTTVTESPLTGGVPDQPPVSNGDIPRIFSGLLPGIDPFPLVQTSAAPALRPSAALSPAAFRSANGDINVYFARTGASNAPGQPYSLFHSRMAWNPTLGTFVAANFGAPTNNPFNSTGALFGPGPVNPIDPTPGVGASNVAPFVLHDTLTGDGATLFYLNSRPTPGGSPVNEVYWSSLNADGSTNGAGLPWITRADPAIQRFGPRAAFAPLATNTTFMFYFGGSPGRWQVYYSARAANATGAPTGNAPDAAVQRNIERQVVLPTAIVSASDPSPVYRQMFVAAPIAGSANVTYAAANVIDLYYTGISRAALTPEIYLSRYRINGQGQNASLALARLPRIVGEQLVSQGREAVWQSRHISWFRSVGNTDVSVVSRLPVVRIQNAAGVPIATLNAAQWQSDAASGTLFQGFRNTANNQLGVAYIDPTAGTVRFRGPGAPVQGNKIVADYEPQTYRITKDAAGNTAPFAFMDRLPLFSTLNLNPTLRNGLITRPQDFTGVNATNPYDVTVNRAADGTGRQWMFWQKAAQAGKPSTLYQLARRVGIDLSSIPVGNGGMAAGESILFSGRDPMTGNQQPELLTVTVNGVNVGAIDMADAAKGRIYIPAQLEGLPIQVTYAYARDAGGAVQSRTAGTAATIYATALDEFLPAGGDQFGRQVPMQQPVNESQPYAFIDTFDPFLTVNRTGATPAAATDPSLSRGRVWLFWVSPCARNGQYLNNGQNLFPSGYDLYWQTLAPAFETFTFSGNAQP